MQRKKIKKNFRISTSRQISFFLHFRPSMLDQTLLPPSSPQYFFIAEEKIFNTQNYIYAVHQLLDLKSFLGRETLAPILQDSKKKIRLHKHKNLYMSAFFTLYLPSNFYYNPFHMEIFILRKNIFTQGPRKQNELLEAHIQTRPAELLKTIATEPNLFGHQNFACSSFFNPESIKRYA